MAQLPRRQIRFYTPNSPCLNDRNPSNWVLDSLAQERRAGFSLDDIVREGFHLGARPEEYKILLPSEVTKIVWENEERLIEERLQKIAETLHKMGDDRLDDDPTGVVTWHALAAEVRYDEMFRDNGSPVSMHLFATALAYDRASREVGETLGRRNAGRAVALTHDGFEDDLSPKCSFTCSKSAQSITPEMVRRGFEICGHPYATQAANALLFVTKNYDATGKKITKGRYSSRTLQSRLSRRVKAADRSHNRHDPRPPSIVVTAEKQELTRKEYARDLKRTEEIFPDEARFVKIVEKTIQDQGLLERGFGRYCEIMGHAAVAELKKSWPVRV